MLCQFERLVYPSSPRDLNPGGYMVAVYRPCEKILDAEGDAVRQVKAVGYYLPTTDKLRYEMRGRWSKNPKFGLQFEVESYDEVIIPSKEGIVAYLSSGQIKGVGPVTAERIYDAFGEETLEVLDRDPERLTACRAEHRLKAAREETLQAATRLKNRTATAAREETLQTEIRLKNRTAAINDL